MVQPIAAIYPPPDGGRGAGFEHVRGVKTRPHLARRPVRRRLPAPASRNAGLFAVLDDRYEIAGTVEPHLPRLEDYAIKLRYVRRKRDAWRARAGLSPWTFRRLSEVAEEGSTRGTATRPDPARADPVLPRLLSHNRRFVVYTDNIHALTARYFPAWSPLSHRDRAKRIQLEQPTCRAPATCSRRPTSCATP